MIARRALLAAAATFLAGPARAEETDAEGRPFSYPRIGQRAPVFTAARAFGGGAFSSVSLRGRWTVLDFWGIWCPDCLVDAPYVAALARAVAQDPALGFLAVHVGDRTGRWPSVAAYMSEKGIDYDVVVDPRGDSWRTFALQWVPTYLVLDPEGVIRGFRTDLARDSAPEGGVKAFLREIAALRGAAR